MTTDEDSVSCRDVSRTFGSGANAVVAVHGSTCRVSPRSQVVIMGPSGSGKSTLLHLMAGLEDPTQGVVRWPGLATDGIERARQIGVVFQSPSLVPPLDVAENVALPLVVGGMPPAQSDARALEAMQRVGVDHLAEKLPEELSGGQAQRVAVARVLAQRPRLVLADEPTGQLDLATGQHIIDVLLTAVTRIGATLVVTTHDPRVAERIPVQWTMHEGRLSTSPKDGGAR